MILEKHAPAFAALTPAMLERVAVGLSSVRPEILELGDFEDGPTLMEYCRSAGISQAELVMSMRDDPAPAAVAAVELLIGRSIDRRSPAQVERERHEAAPRPAVVQKTERTVDARVIRVLATRNPKRPGTAAHDRFALYRDGMTVAEFLAAGGQSGDIRWDSERGLIRVEDPA